MASFKVKQITALVVSLLTVSACSSIRPNLQSSYEDETAWRKFQEEAFVHEAKQENADTEATWKKAIVLFDSHNKASDQAVESRWSLAKYYEYKGQFTKAEPLFAEIVAIKEKQVHYLGLGGNLEDLADCNYFQGKYKEAADLYGKALAIEHKLNGPRSELALSRKLANCYVQLGKNKEAAALYQNTIELGYHLNPLVGPVYGYLVALDTFLAVKDYATMLARQGNNSQLPKLKEQATLIAARLVSQAIAQEQMVHEFSPDNRAFQEVLPQLRKAPNLAPIIQIVFRRACNAAVIDCQIGQYVAAEDLYERLLEMALAGQKPNQALADLTTSLHQQWCHCMHLAPGPEPSQSNYTVENPYLTAFQLIRTKQEYVDKKLAFSHKYAWAIPSQLALDTIADYGPIVEIGAGTGYWAYLLRQMHVDVVADDIAPVPSKQNASHYLAGASWTNVMQGDENLVSKYPQRTLMLCWPDAGKNLFSYNALSKYKGNRLIYIGEDPGGQTACQQFFDLLKRDWHPVKKVQIPRWPDNYDNLYVFERNQ